MTRQKKVSQTFSFSRGSIDRKVRKIRLRPVLSHLLISRIFPRKRIFQQSHFSLVIRGSHRWVRFIKTPKISWYCHFFVVMRLLCVNCLDNSFQFNGPPFLCDPTNFQDSAESRRELSWTALSQDECYPGQWTALSQDECYPGQHWVKMSECYSGQRWVKMSAILDTTESRWVSAILDSAESRWVLSWTALSQDECYPGQHLVRMSAILDSVSACWHWETHSRDNSTVI